MRGGWAQLLFWGWQALYAVLIAMVLAAVALEDVLPPGHPLVEVLGFPVVLAPLLGPAWLPVTVVLGAVLLLRRRGRKAAPS